MKRDMDVIRQIVLSIADSKLGKLVTEVDGIDNATCAAHAVMLFQPVTYWCSGERNKGVFP